MIGRSPPEPEELTLYQELWLKSLGPERRRRFDALPFKPGWRSWTRTWILDFVAAGDWSDPIIAAEIERILGPEDVT
jgi:hypothetical protein